MLLEPRADGLRLLARLLIEVRCDVRRRRRRRRAHQLVEHPRSSQNRETCGRRRKCAAAPRLCPVMPHRSFVRQRDPAELGAEALRRCRSGAPAVRSGTCGRRSANPRRCDLQEECCSRNSWASVAKSRRSCIGELGKQHRVGLHGIEIGDVQPLHRKAGDQARSFGIRQHAR